MSKIKWRTEWMQNSVCAPSADVMHTKGDSNYEWFKWSGVRLTWHRDPNNTRNTLMKQPYHYGPPLGADDVNTHLTENYTLQKRESLLPLGRMAVIQKSTFAANRFDFVSNKAAEASKCCYVFEFDSEIFSKPTEKSDLGECYGWLGAFESREWSPQIKRQAI